MKVYETQQQVEEDIKNDVLRIDGNVKFKCSIAISVSILVAGDIDAWDITARDITAWSIKARNINAWNIVALNINADSITTGNITAMDIIAGDITAGDINYYAFCCVYRSIKCKSIKARREKAHKPICLDGKLTIKK